MKKLRTITVGIMLLSVCTLFSFVTAFNGPTIHDGNILAAFSDNKSSTGWRAKKISKGDSGSSSAKTTDLPDTRVLPIIMYHGLIKDPTLQTVYYIDPGIFESDMLYLREHGYETVFISQLTDYVNGEGELPEKPIIITFDDGYYNNYYYAYPYLREYEMKAVISIIGNETDRFSAINENVPAYSYLTWMQIAKMSGSGTVEFQNHTYDMHDKSQGRRGANIKPGESKWQYRRILKDDLSKLQTKLYAATGKTPQCFTYPYGAYSTESESIIKKMGFTASLTCTEGINVITRGDRECLYLLKRYLRSPGKTTEDYFEDIEGDFPKADGDTN